MRVRSVKLFCYTSDGLALLMKLANRGTDGTKPYGTKPWLETEFTPKRLLSPFKKRVSVPSRESNT
jgi:hypothetical protein